MSNEWFERGELPPVGTECEWRPFSPTKAKWKSCLIDFIHGDNICITNYDSFKNKQVVSSVQFRQIRTEREKAIEAAMKIHMPFDSDEEGFGALYDAGLLRLPEDKK